MIKKFIFRNVAQKFTKVRQKSFADPIAKRDMAAKIAARTEGRSHRILTKKVESAFARSALKPGKANQFSSLVKQKNRALTKAFTLSQKRGIKTFTKANKKLGVTPSGIKDRPAKYYRGTKRGLPKGMTSQEMGWAPEDPFNATQKAFYMKGKPMPKIKAHRKTLSKVYATKKSWKDRSKVIKETRQKIKGQIKIAKMDRHADLYRTTQQQTGTTRTGKPIWKTIRRYDVGDLTKWNIKKPK
tara:strand:+ start:33 stop:758 length:726 start_codon:yes stop_codon:yes gene_type:complete